MTRTIPANKLNQSAEFIINVISSRLFLILVFLWFIFQAIYMAFSTKYGIPPDERFHYGTVQLFAQNGWLPFIHNQLGHYNLGEVAHTPYFLYGYILSIPYHFLNHVHGSIYILRLLNIALGTASLYVAYRLFSKLGLPKAVRNLSIFMMANTLMFVFLSASVSYDNLFIFIVISGLTLIVDLYQRFDVFKLLLLLIVIAAGLMSKVSFLPIAIGFISALAYICLKNKKTAKLQIKESFAKKPKSQIVIIAVLILLFGLLIQRYAVNTIRYHSLAPSYAKVNSAQCVGKTSPPCLPAKRMLPPPDTRHLDLVEYIPTWFFEMRAGFFDIEGHKFISELSSTRIWTEVFLIVGIILLIRFGRIENRLSLILVSVVAIYSLAQFFENYLFYRHSWVIQAGLQGRYLFAVLPLIYLVVNYAIWDFIKSSIFRAIYIFMTLIIFIMAGLPTYILHTNSDWHTNKTVRLNTEIKDKF